MSDVGARRAAEAAASLGFSAVRVEPIEGDASRRMFYRVFTPERTAIAAVYPEGAEDQAERDACSQCWGWSRRLPIPEPLGRVGLVTLSEDLGSEDLEHAVGERGESVLAAALDTLADFQRCCWDDCPTPAFDGAFFRRELAAFEQQVVPVAIAESAVIAGFLDDLAARLERHPYRLVHRDFHVNNLFLQGGRVRAVDFQDMRGGPDTYDAVSLLRERAGGERIESDIFWRVRAAAMLGWAAGWEERYDECAAQRGLKVVGTFVRLVGCGRTHYLAWLPLVRQRAREAVEALAGPGQLIDLLGPRVP